MDGMMVLEADDPAEVGAEAEQYMPAVQESRSAEAAIATLMDKYADKTLEQLEEDLERKLIFRRKLVAGCTARFDQAIEELQQVIRERKRLLETPVEPVSQVQQAQSKRWLQTAKTNQEIYMQEEHPTTSTTTAGKRPMEREQAHSMAYSSKRSKTLGAQQAAAARGLSVEPRKSKYASIPLHSTTGSQDCMVDEILTRPKLGNRPSRADEDDDPDFQPGLTRKGNMQTRRQSRDSNSEKSQAKIDSYTTKSPTGRCENCGKQVSERTLKDCSSEAFATSDAKICTPCWDLQQRAFTKDANGKDRRQSDRLQARSPVTRRKSAQLKDGPGCSRDNAVELLDSDEEAPDPIPAPPPPEQAVAVRKSTRIPARLERPYEKIQGLKAVYPSADDPDAVEVLADDLRRLQPEEFLNDTCIDLKLRILQKENAMEYNSFHIFNSFFYKKLTQKTGNSSEAPHARVKRWTKNVNIFEKDFVFVPIHHDLHWSLVVICFPGYADQGLKQPAILHLDSLPNGHSFQSIKKALLAYLGEEWAARQEQEAPEAAVPFDKKKFVTHRMPVPQQNNHCDCGLFLLVYVQQILFSGPNLVQLTRDQLIAAAKGKGEGIRLGDHDEHFLGKKWFLPGKAFEEREVLQSWIYKQIYEYSKANNVPESDARMEFLKDYLEKQQLLEAQKLEAQQRPPAAAAAAAAAEPAVPEEPASSSPPPEPADDEHWGEAPPLTLASSLGDSVVDVDVSVERTQSYTIVSSSEDTPTETQPVLTLEEKRERERTAELRKNPHLVPYGSSDDDEDEGPASLLQRMDARRDSAKGASLPPPSPGDRFIGPPERPPTDQPEGGPSTAMEVELWEEHSRGGAPAAAATDQGEGHTISSEEDFQIFASSKRRAQVQSRLTAGADQDFQLPLPGDRADNAADFFSDRRSTPADDALFAEMSRARAGEDCTRSSQHGRHEGGGAAGPNAARLQGTPSQAGEAARNPLVCEDDAPRTQPCSSDEDAEVIEDSEGEDSSGFERRESGGQARTRQTPSAEDVIEADSEWVDSEGESDEEEEERQEEGRGTSAAGGEARPGSWPSSGSIDDMDSMGAQQLPVMPSRGLAVPESTRPPAGLVSFLATNPRVPPRAPSQALVPQPQTIQGAARQVTREEPERQEALKAGKRIPFGGGSHLVSAAKGNKIFQGGVHMTTSDDDDEKDDLAAHYENYQALEHHWGGAGPAQYPNLPPMKSSGHRMNATPPPLQARRHS